MKPSEYQKLASRTECDQKAASYRRYSADTESGHPQIATRLSHGVLGLTGEVGELAYALEKWLQYGQDLDHKNLREELGDCMWYIALFCNTLGLSLEEVMESNIAKLKKRFPDKFDEKLVKEENRDREAEVEAADRVLIFDSTSQYKTFTCPECRTPFSHRVPRYCPECGITQPEFKKTVHRNIS